MADYRLVYQTSTKSGQDLTNTNKL